MGKKRLAVVFILIMLCITAAICVFADGERNDIQMKAEVGFDGYFRLEQWTPITVEIENNGADIQGTLEVVANQDSTSAVIFSRPAVVPKNSKKRFVLYVQVNTIQKEMNIKLVQEGKTIKTYEVKGLMPLTWSKYLLGVVTEDKAGMSYWWNILSNDRIFADHETVHMDLQDLPERKEVLDNFRILVFNNADTSLMTKEQKTALISWIEDGGILIVGTGANGNKTLSGLSPEILPLQAGNIISINSVDELSKIADNKLPDNSTLQVMNLRPNVGEFVVQGEEHNLVWKHQIGKGYIFVSAFDLGLEPIVNWVGNKTFWGKLLLQHLDAETVTELEEPEIQRNTAYSIDSYYQVRDALSSIAAMEMPSFSGLLILLLAYLVIVGPVNYIILKKLDKREWAWATIPLIVILFSAAIYTVGYSKKGNEVIANTISVVRLSPNASFAQLDSYIGIFIPKKGDYSVSLNEDVLVRAFDYSDYGYYGPASGGGEENKKIQAKVNQGHPASLELYDANVWTMRILAMSDIKPDFGSLESELYYYNGKIEGRITNNTPYPLSDLVVYTPYGYQKIGNIASGESKQVELAVKTQSFNKHRNETVYQMINTLYPYSNRDRDEEKEARVRRSLLDGFLVRPMETGMGMVNGGSFVKAFAFCDANLGKNNIEVNGKEPEQSYYKNLVMADLDVVCERDGVISTPPGYISPIINTELSDSISPEAGGIYLDRGQVVFEFLMKPYEEIELSKIEINTDSFYGKPFLSIYDTESKEFVEAGDGIEIDQVQGIITIEPEALEKYINEEGNLQIKVETGSRNPVSMPLPSLVIEGRRR